MDFLLSRDFYPRAHARVNKIEAIYEVLPVTQRLSENFYVYTRPFVHCLYFISARKKYATVEIHPTKAVDL